VLFSNTEVEWDGQDIQHVQEMTHVLHVKFLSKISTVRDQAKHLDVEGVGCMFEPMTKNRVLHVMRCKFVCSF
jgi:hypothetical protein